MISHMLATYLYRPYMDDRVNIVCYSPAFYAGFAFCIFVSYLRQLFFCLPGFYVSVTDRAGFFRPYFSTNRSRAAFRAGVSSHFRGHRCTICCPLYLRK